MDDLGQEVLGPFILRVLKDLLGRGAAEALLQEELHTGGQDTLLRSLPVITGTNGDRLLSVVFRIHSNISDSS